MTINELMAKYKNEKVLCIRNAKIDRQSELSLLEKIMYYGYLDYRYKAELDFTARQIIPYVVVMHEDKILTTRRIQGDHRLVGRMSIGTGGHINPEDVVWDTKFTLNVQKTCGQCIIRELTEETLLKDPNEPLLVYHGDFYSETDEVSKVHHCLLFVAHVESEFGIREIEKLEGTWLTPQQIAENYEQLENWSQIAFSMLGLTKTATKTNENAKRQTKKRSKKEDYAPVVESLSEDTE